MNYNLEKNTNNSKKIIIGISMLFSAVILIVGATTAYFTQSGIGDTGNIVTTNINGTIDYIDNKDYMKNNLIPVIEEDVVKFAMKNSLNNYTDNDICKYNDEYNACSLYEFTITNNADVTQELKVSMSPTLNQYGNLYFAVLEGNRTNLTPNSKIVHNYTHIQQDTINFDDLNLILKPKESKTYTIVFYIKSLNIDQTSVDSGKTFAASIKVDSITTGYNVSNQLGEGCYESVKLDDGTYKLTRFNGINHETGDIIEGCGVTKDGDYYSVTVPSTYGGNTISTLGNSLFFPVYLEELDTSDIVSLMMSTKHYYIKELKINEGITTIEDGIGFGEIESFGDVDIGLFVFGGMDAINQQPLNEDGVKISLPNSLKYIGNYAFNVSLIKDIRLPNNLEYIGNRSFANNPYLTDIYIPASVKEIGNYAFEYAKIQTLTIPSSVQTIGDGAFISNINLTKLTIKDTIDKPSQLKTIGEHAFFETDLTYDGTSEEEYLQLPASITEIGNAAFKGMSGPNNLIAIRFKGTREQLDLLGTNWYFTTRTTVKAINE